MREASIHTVPDVQPPTKSVKRPCLVHRAPPVTGWLRVSAEQCSPFGPVPLQNVHPYYELLCPCAPHRRRLHRVSFALQYRRPNFWASMSDYLGRKATYYTFFLLGIALYPSAPTLAHSGNTALFVLVFGIIVSV